MKKVWHDEAWEDYLKLQTDKKLLKKANALLKDIERGGYDGIVKRQSFRLLQPPRRVWLFIQNRYFYAAVFLSAFFVYV